MLDDAVLDLQTLHVLTADVQNELDVRDEGLGASQVRDGLDLAGVGAKGLDEDLLAVAGGGHVADGASLGKQVVDTVHDVAGGAEDVAVVVAVPGVEELSALAHHGALHRGGAGVDADEHAALIGGQVALGNHLLVVTLLELLVVLLALEERLEARDLGALGVLEVLEQLDDFVEGHVLLGLPGERRARGHEEVGVLGHDDVLFVEVEREVEALAELREVLERAAEKRHVAADGVATRQARDRLVGHGLEDGGRDVGGLGALVEQRLDVRLGEDAAAGGDGVDLRGVLGELVEARGIGVEQARHLVDEGARASRAGSVHALLDAVVEVDDLRVLAAELDGTVRLRNERLHGALGGDDLLHELEVKPTGKQHAAGAGDGDAHRCRADHLARAGEELLRRGADVRVVTLVVGIDEVVVVVDDGELHRGGTHVDAQTQVRVGEVGVSGRRELGAVLLEGERAAGGLLGLDGSGGLTH